MTKQTWHKVEGPAVIFALTRCGAARASLQREFAGAIMPAWQYDHPPPNPASAMAIADPRRLTRNRKHLLSDVLLSGFCGVLAEQRPGRDQHG